MTKLQCVIVYSMHDSPDISDAGDSLRQVMLREKMADIYFLSSKKDNPHLLYVKLFLD